MTLCLLEFQPRIILAVVDYFALELRRIREVFFGEHYAATIISSQSEVVLIDGEDSLHRLLVVAARVPPGEAVILREFEVECGSLARRSATWWQNHRSPTAELDRSLTVCPDSFRVLSAKPVTNHRLSNRGPMLPTAPSFALG